MTDLSTLTWFFFKFTGRIGRAAYLLSFLLTMVVVLFPFYQFMRFPEGSAAAENWSLVILVVGLLSGWTQLATTAKRFHDLGKNGFMSLVLFIPVISIIAFIYLCLTPGTPGPNKYGIRVDSPD